MQCHAGCDFRLVRDALGLETNGNKTVSRKEPSAIYDYTDEHGQLLFQTLRYFPKDFKQRRPDGNGGWIWNLQDVKRVLYRLPEIKDAEFVYFVEGERDVETLRSHGEKATCSPLGAGKWRSEFAEEFRGKVVPIIPDNDEPGRKHAEQVAQSLLGIAKEVLFLALPNLPEKGDVTDFFNDGGTMDDLRDLIARAEPWNPSRMDFAVTEDDVPQIDDEINIPTLSEDALYGLPGDIVRALEPHTESDNSALLIQFLAGFGCLIGKTAYFRVEADSHYTKLFAVLVGASSKGRKGTSLKQITNLLTRVDESFLECMQDGLSSGEGLIHHVRDSQSKQTAIKEKGKITGYQEEIVDQGATEKRVFITEPEFARVLRAMQREGNTLSSIIRQAWDSDRLRVMTKNPLKASETHISIVGHITRDELQRNLDETETANGFANRFLWAFVRRSKYLPEGGNLEASQLNDLVLRIREAVEFSRGLHELKKDEQARKKWYEIYPSLSDGHTGLLGSVTSRAEAQVMRLSCLYSLLDLSETIKLQHLNSALAVWRYCENSAKHIFGNQSGNRLADTLFAALDGAGDEGLTRTDIRDLFKRNASSNQIDHAIRFLVELGRIEVTKEKGTGGRPREICKVRRHAQNDINDKRVSEES